MSYVKALARCHLKDSVSLPVTTRGTFVRCQWLRWAVTVQHHLRTVSEGMEGKAYDLIWEVVPGQSHVKPVNVGCTVFAPTFRMFCVCFGVCDVWLGGWCVLLSSGRCLWCSHDEEHLILRKYFEQEVGCGQQLCTGTTDRLRICLLRHPAVPSENWGTRETSHFQL